MAAVEVENAEFAYQRGIPVLAGASLGVKEGEVHVLLGDSGCGKTTLLRAIAGFEGLDGGLIRLADRIVDSGAGGVWLPPERRSVGVVFQDYALFPHLNVLGNICFSGASKSRGNELLAAVELTEFAERPVADLSGGQKQRVALVRALAQEPSVILLDEPFSNLNPGLREHLRELTADLIRDSGITAIFVTHDHREACALADRMSVIHNGKVLQSGTSTEVYSQPQTLEVARALGEVNCLPASSLGQGWCSSVLGQLAVSGAPTTAIMVRPESLFIREEGALGVVLRSRFLGSHYRLIVEVRGERLLVRANCAIEPGEKIKLAAAEPVCWVAK